MTQPPQGLGHSVEAGLLHKKNANAYSCDNCEKDHNTAKDDYFMACVKAVQGAFTLDPFSSRDEKMREANEGNGKRQGNEGTSRNLDAFKVEEVLHLEVIESTSKEATRENQEESKQGSPRHVAQLVANKFVGNVQHVRHTKADAQCREGREG